MSAPGGNTVVIRIRVADQTAVGFRDAEGRLRDARGRFVSEGNLMGQGLSRGIGRGANDASAALAGLAKGGIAIPILLGLAASATNLAGALLLIPAAAGAAAGIFGALGVGMSGVSDALGATSSSAGSAGAAVADMSRQIRDANRAIEDAQRGVGDANRRLEDAHRGVEEAARRVEDAHRGVDDALRRLEGAQRNVTDASHAYARAQADEREALADIDSARRDAIRTLEDLAEAQSDSVRNVEGAELSLKRALADQQKTMKNSKATALDRAEAAFRVKEAQDKLSDSQLASKDATEKLSDAERKGVEGSDQVTAAKERATDAHERTADAARRVADAEQGVADARRGVADAERGVQDAMRGVEDAQRGVEDAERGVADAHRAVADAQQNLADVLEQQGKAAAGAAGGMDAYAAALAKLAPEARQFVETVVALRDEWDAMTRSVQNELFDGLAEKVQGLADVYIPALTTGLGGIAAALNDMATYAADALMDPAVVEAVNTVLANTASMLAGAKTALGDFLAGFIELAAIGSEYLPPVGEWLARIAAQFREWVETDPDGVRQFIDEALQGLADLWAIGENVVGIIMAIADGLASGQGEGQTFLDTIRGLTESLLAFVQSEGVQGLLAFIGTVVQKMIEFAPVTLGVIGVLALLQGAIAAVNFVIGAYNAIMMIVRGVTIAWTAVQWALNAALFANPIGLVVLAVAALVAAFIWAWNNIEGFRNFWIAVWDAIVAAFNWTKDTVVTAWNWLIDNFTRGAHVISGALGGMWNGLVGGLKWAANGAISLLNGLIHNINVIIGGMNAINPFGSIPYVGYVGYLAKGGNASGLNVVGENGPELVDLPAGSRVHTAGDSRRMLEQQGSGGGGPMVVEMRFAGNTDGAMATAIMKLVRTGQLQLSVAR